MNILHGDEVFVHSAQTHSQMTMSQAMRREQMQPMLKPRLHPKHAKRPSGFVELRSPHEELPVSHKVISSKNKIRSAQLTTVIRKHPHECQIVPPGGDKQNCKHRMTGRTAVKETEQKDERSLFGITRI